ncbi:hypothetical protein [Echinicola shivajiensis]|uniref:hypothetical protein n=1 Tax=Echinicola shivajiensis TaxID=1035916 RepID=UPI001BFC79B9|nr:hypothetical protein [Echinicola shivajiensis]
MNNQQIESLSLSIIGTTSAQLPPPWSTGAGVVVKVLSELFGLFGKSSPNISQLIQQAVQDLENFWENNQIQNGQDSINAFLSWYQQNLNNQSPIDSPEDKDYIVNSLLPILSNQLDPSLKDSGISQLYMLSDPRFLNANICTNPGDNTALNVLVLCISALCSTRQMMMLLNAKLASFGMPKPDISPDSLNDDTQFQSYMTDWMDIQNSFDLFVNGNGEPIPEGANYQESAQFIGWAGAISKYLNDWLAYREGQVQTTSKVVRGADIGWVFWVTDHCTGNQQASDLGWTKEQAEQWAVYTRNQMIAPFQGMITGVQNVVNQWKEMVTHWKSLLPLGQPSQSSIEITSWGEEATSESHWYGVEQVRYGVSFTNENGPSLRSDWSGAWVDTNGKSNPTISGLPTLKAGQGTRQIWRQFKISGDQNSIPLGTPMIVENDSGESSILKDASTLVV